MTNKITVDQFDTVYPQDKKKKPMTRKETFELAHRVASALKKEREKLVKEYEQTKITSGFFSAST